MLPSQEEDTLAGVCATVGPRASAELSTIGYPREIHPHTPSDSGQRDYHITSQ